MHDPTPTRRRARLTTDEYVEGVLAADRATLARAITLIESNGRRHQDQAQELLVRLLPHAVQSQRIGITGVPGVGKSTFIEAIGTYLTGLGHKLAVLAVDPTSTVSGGSILGDKTRMARLSADENAFIRPSPSAGTLGGVTRKTRETMIVLEAAGHDVVLVETVGVGQSETEVADMVDFFLVLMLAGAGDELQGIKRGVLELADMLVINKADGDNLKPARRAAQEYQSALHYVRPSTATWKPPVLTCSSIEGRGIDQVWSRVLDHREKLTLNGELQRRREAQRVKWMWRLIEDQLIDRLRRHPQVEGRLEQLEHEVRAGLTTPTLGARDVLESFLGDGSRGVD